MSATIDLDGDIKEVNTSSTNLHDETNRREKLIQEIKNLIDP